MFRYNEGGEIIEITVRDNTGAKIENWKFKINDKRAGGVIQTIIKKYGLESKDKDMDWLKKKDW
tara:strand:- start:144 stop:335 length:192 start_codon:yes stop_codon:yes gene_type:complete